MFSRLSDFLCTGAAQEGSRVVTILRAPSNFLFWGAPGLQPKTKILTVFNKFVTKFFFNDVLILTSCNQIKL